LNLTIKPVNLLLENIVQDRIGHAAYGIFAALNALAFLFIVLVDLGLNQFLTKKFAAEINVHPEKYSTYFSFKVVLAVVYPFIMILIGYLLGYSNQELFILFLISTSYSLYQLLMYIRAKFQASQFFTLDSLASISDKTLLIVFTLLLLAMGITLNNYVEARLLAMLLSLAIFIIPAVRIYSHRSFAFNWNHTAWKTILKQSYPFAFITVLFSVHDKIDQVMIERMLGDEASGLYAGAYRWLDAFMMFLWIILPMFFARFAFVKKSPEELSKILTMSQIISGIPMIFVSCFVWFYGEQLFFLLGSSSIEEIIEMTICLKILFVAVFIHAFFACLGTLLSATGGENYINRMLLFSIGINVALNFFLLPLMGIAGAAIATVISTLLISVSYLIYIIKNQHVPVDARVFIKLFVLALVTGFAFYLNNQLHVEWWLASVISGITLLTAAFLLKFHRIVLKK
jgi:O-antigen/teichoic acid export membrane protein